MLAEEMYINRLLRTTHAWAINVEYEYINMARLFLNSISQTMEPSYMSHRIIEVIKDQVYPRFEYYTSNDANSFLHEVGYSQRIGPHQILVVYHSCEISANYYDCEFWRESSRSLSKFVHKQVKSAKRSGLFLNRLSRIGVHEELYHYFWTAELSRNTWNAANGTSAQV